MNRDLQEALAVLQEIAEVAGTEGMDGETVIPIWPKDVAHDFSKLKVRHIEALLASKSETSTLEDLARAAGWAGTVPAEKYLHRYIARTEHLAGRGGKHPMGNVVKATASPYDPDPNAPKEYPGE